MVTELFLLVCESDFLTSFPYLADLARSLHSFLYELCMVDIKHINIHLKV